MSTRLQVLTFESSHTSPAWNQPASCQMTTSLQAPKYTKKYTSKTSYNMMYMLHTSNELTLPCKGSNS